MNVPVIILLVIVGLIVLLLLLALVAPKKYDIQRDMIINRSPTDVFNYARMLKNQEEYNVWVMRDPNLNIVYTGMDGTVGAKSSWKSANKNVGEGEQEIMNIREGESIDVELRFRKPFETTGSSRTTISEAANGSTRIHMRYFGHSKVPFNLMNFMLDKMLGKDMMKNLNNMKEKLEKNR